MLTIPSKMKPAVRPLVTTNQVTPDSGSANPREMEEQSNLEKCIHQSWPQLRRRYWLIWRDNLFHTSCPLQRTPTHRQLKSRNMQPRFTIHIATVSYLHFQTAQYTVVFKRANIEWLGFTRARPGLAHLWLAGFPHSIMSPFPVFDIHSENLFTRRYESRSFRSMRDSNFTYHHLFSLPDVHVDWGYYEMPKVSPSHSILRFRLIISSISTSAEESSVMQN